MNGLKRLAIRLLVAAYITKICTTVSVTQSVWRIVYVGLFDYYQVVGP